MENDGKTAVLDLAAMYVNLKALETALAESQTKNIQLGEQLEARIKVLEESNARWATLYLTLERRIEEQEALWQIQLNHKNSSSASKREMTKDDARRVLAGDKAHLEHKHAAEELGLTYAQVYSCRFGYTFKEVHRELEKEGWTNTQWIRRG